MKIFFKSELFFILATIACIILMLLLFASCRSEKIKRMIECEADGEIVYSGPLTYYYMDYEDKVLIIEIDGKKSIWSFPYTTNLHCVDWKESHSVGNK